MQEPDSTTTACVSESSGLTQKNLPFRLTGSQAKTAFAIRRNVEAMISGNGEYVLKDKETKTIRDADGNEVEKFIPAHWICTRPEYLNQTGFLTLTVGDYFCGEHGQQVAKPGGAYCPVCAREMVFRQVFDAAEASARVNNLNRRILKNIFVRAVIVTERHKNKAIHFHLIGILKSGVDIRTGFDFKAFDKAKVARNAGSINRAAEMRYKLSTNGELFRLWQMMRETLPLYGFGRAELTPIKKTGEAVACYVSKYLEKNIFNRVKEDKRKKLVRYIGDWKTVKQFEDGTCATMIGKRLAPEDSAAPHKLKPNDFGWCSKRATAWRGKARETASLINCTSPEDCKAALGGRWAYYLSTTWQGRTPDDLSPFLIADSYTKRQLANDLIQISRRRSPGWWEQSEKPMEPFVPAEYFPGWPAIYAEPMRQDRPKFDADASFVRNETGQIIGTFDELFAEYQLQEKNRLAEIAAAALN